MKIQERYYAVLSFFEKHLPNAETELHYKTPFQLLVSVVLSAQCTDKRVNQITPKLFHAFPTPQKMAKATKEEVFTYIQSISYPNNKANHLVRSAQMLCDTYQGNVPSSVEELITLPGVGRKTANVLTSVLFGAPHMAVDTHVFRVSHRLGLVTKKETTPLAVEKKLIQYIPTAFIHKAHHWLILHGRYVCLARKPLCHECGFTHFCSHFKELNKA